MGRGMGWPLSCFIFTASQQLDMNHRDRHGSTRFTLVKVLAGIMVTEHFKEAF